jgi:hypothetical protein
MIRFFVRGTGIAGALHLLTAVSLACPNCFGDPQSGMTEGMNMAILSLLGITGAVLVGIVAFFLHMRRRVVEFERRFQNLVN